jgi:hypothetical protein
MQYASRRDRNAPFIIKTYISEKNRMQSTDRGEAGRQQKSILVFPATHPAGRDYFEAAKERGEQVIAASSIRDVELEAELGQLLHLPNVYEADFAQRFLELVQQYHVSSVYAPVTAVYSWLEKFIRNHAVQIRLIGDSPVRREVDRFNRLKDKAGRYKKFIDACAHGRNELSVLEIASIFKAANAIYGESNDQKIAAMMAIFSSAPKGDVIEIGSLVGKSAAVLALLARRYHIGHVLAVDPWLPAPALQHDSPDIVRANMLIDEDWETFPENFTVNTLPAGLGILNYLRHESAKGFEAFRNHPEVSSPVFGTVRYTGQASVIHIDGNHDYSQVKQDCELWLRLLAPDGWLIVDDYQWAHGDGPYRVGNALLIERANDIERSFVCGKALFIKFGRQ